MKSYTKSIVGIKHKYPVTSTRTGNTYEVTIYPYSGNEDRYLDGCVVTLLRKGFLHSKELISKHFDNDSGKISISHWSSDNKTKTDFDYNLISMANLIVQLYETNNKRQLQSVGQLNKDFAEFSKWDGIV